MDELTYEPSQASLNLAQRQQDFDMAERRARFALECAKSAGPWAYTQEGELLPMLSSAINDFLVAKD